MTHVNENFMIKLIANLANEAEEEGKKHRIDSIVSGMQNYLLVIEEECVTNQAIIG